MSRLMPLSGVAFVVVGLLAVVALGGSTPDTSSTGAEVQSFYADNDVRQAIAAFVLALSVLFLVLFAVSLATDAAAAANVRGHSFWPLVTIAGSVLAGVCFLITAAIHFALVDAADQGLSGEALEALNSLDGNTWIAYNAGLGVMMLGAAGVWLTAIRRNVWLGWSALVLGVALFIPFADFVALLLTLVWILIASVLLFRERAAPDAAVAMQA